jgi:hypothetical protein
MLPIPMEPVSMAALHVSISMCVLADTMSTYDSGLQLHLYLKLAAFQQ